MGEILNLPDLPFARGVSAALRLVSARAFSWLMVVVASVWFCFLVCPMENTLSLEELRMAREERELVDLRADAHRLRSIRALVADRDGFTMERLVRAEFNLVGPEP